MTGRQAKSRGPASNAKGIRKKDAADDKYAQLSRELNREVKKVSKMKQQKMKFEKHHELQPAYFQEKIRTIKNKVVKLERDVTKKKQLTIENEKLREKVRKLKIETKELKQIGGDSVALKYKINGGQMVTRSRSVTRRIIDALAEFESREPEEETLPPSDTEIKATVSEMVRETDLETTKMKDLITQVEGKYSRFDLSDKRALIKSYTKVVVRRMYASTD